MMKRAKHLLLWLALGGVLGLILVGSMRGQTNPPTTPNIGLQVPARGTYNWDTFYNNNWNLLDGLLSGTSSSSLKYVPPFTGGLNRTLNSKLSDVISLKDFGAVGDGITDDSAAVAKAMVAAAGHELKVPAGNYLVNASIPLETNTTLNCDSGAVEQGYAVSGGAVFTFAPGFTGWGVSNPSYGMHPSVAYSTIRNCTFDLSNAPAAQGGILVRSVMWGSFQNVTVLLPRTGSLVGMLFDGEDSSIGNGTYWNTVTGSRIRGYSAGALPVFDPAHGNHLFSTHTGIIFENSANSNYVRDTNIAYVSNIWQILLSTNNVLIEGGGSDAYDGTLLLIDGTSSWNEARSFRGEVISTFGFPYATAGIVFLSGSYGNRVSPSYMSYPASYVQGMYQDQNTTPQNDISLRLFGVSNGLTSASSLDIQAAQVPGNFQSSEGGIAPQGSGRTINGGLWANGGVSLKSGTSWYSILTPTGGNVNATIPGSIVQYNPSSVGSNLVTCGDFSCNTGWTFNAGWAWNSSTHQAVATAATSANWLLTSIADSAGTMYQITFTVAGYGGGSVRPALGGTAVAYGSTVNDNGTYVQYILAPSPVANGTFGFAPVSAFTGTITNVTVKSVAGGLVQSALMGTTASIGGSALTVGTCSTGTVSVPNATTAMSVVASPVIYPGAAFYWQGYVSSSNAVTVAVCAAAAGTPAATAYNVRVSQ